MLFCNRLTTIHLEQIWSRIHLHLCQWIYILRPNSRFWRRLILKNCRTHHLSHKNCLEYLFVEIHLSNLLLPLIQHRLNQGFLPRIVDWIQSQSTFNILKNFILNTSSSLLVQLKMKGLQSLSGSLFDSSWFWSISHFSSALFQMCGSGQWWQKSWALEETYPGLHWQIPW